MSRTLALTSALAAASLLTLVSAPAQAELHLRALGGIARLLSDDSVREELLAARTPDDFFERLRGSETDQE